MTLLQPTPQFLHRLKSVDGSKSLHVRYIILASQRRSLNARSLIDTFFPNDAQLTLVVKEKVHCKGIHLKYRSSKYSIK